MPNNFPSTDTRTPEQWFDEVFWMHYPRKVKRMKARGIFISIVTGKHKKIERIEPRAICEGMWRYSQLVLEQGREQTFILHASTWLNECGWEDAKQYHFEYLEILNRKKIKASKPRSTRDVPLEEKLTDLSWILEGDELE